MLDDMAVIIVCKLFPIVPADLSLGGSQMALHLSLLNLLIRNSPPLGFVRMSALYPGAAQTRELNDNGCIFLVCTAGCSMNLYPLRLLMDIVVETGLIPIGIIYFQSLMLCVALPLGAPGQAALPGL